MKPHKHAELIKLWADGAVIQVKTISTFSSYWEDCLDNDPTWQRNCEYRIKPEPKPDMGIVFYVEKLRHQKTHDFIQCNPFKDVNLKLTFDGETGELKSAEVLK